MGPLVLAFDILFALVGATIFSTVLHFKEAHEFRRFYRQYGITKAEAEASLKDGGI
jgi:hypothetical protein